MIGRALVSRAETWALKKAHEKKLEVAEMRMLRWKGAIQVLRNAVGGGGCQISRKKALRRLRFNVIALRGGGWGSNFQEKNVT